MLCKKHNKNPAKWQDFLLSCSYNSLLCIYTHHIQILLDYKVPGSTDSVWHCCESLNMNGMNEGMNSKGSVWGDEC